MNTEKFLRRFATYFFCAIIGQYSLNAQTHRLSGTVKDSTTHRPLENATIFIVELSRGVSSDNNGVFALSSIPAGRYSIICRLLGYADVTDKIWISKNSELDFNLAPTNIELSEVKITGTRNADVLIMSNKSVSVLSGQELQKVRGQTLGETLENISGVTVLQTGPSISKPVIRGLHSDRVVVINSGIAQEGQQWGGEHAPEIDPFSASRIEVLKGAAGIEYGAGAIGGVINIEPKPLRDVPGIDGQISLNGFSNNKQGAGSIFLEGVSEYLPEFAWRLQASGRKAGSSSTPDYVIGNTGFEETVGSFTLGYTAESFGAEAYYSYFDTQLGIYRGSHVGSLSDLQRALLSGRPLAQYDFTYDIDPPMQKISHELWSVKGHYDVPSLGHLEIQYGRQSNHRQEFDAFRFFNNVQSLPKTPAFGLTLTTYSTDVKFKHNPIGDFYGTIGVSGTRQGNVREGTSFLVPNFRLYSGGVYIIEEWAHDDVTLNAGMRYDYRSLEVFPYEPKKIDHSNHAYGNLSFAFGAIDQFSKTWSLAANLGTAFRPPNISELYSDGVHHGTAEYERGDPSLKNERSYSIDMTLRHQGAESRGEISVYYNYMQNFIFLFPEPQPVFTLRGAFPAFSYQQGNSVLRGIDGFWNVDITSSVTVGANVSLVRGDNLETHQPLFQMPSDRLRLTTKFLLPDFWSCSNSSVEPEWLLVQHQERIPLNVDYVPPPAGYGLVGCTFDSEISLWSQKIQCSISFKNLLDKRYRDYMSRNRYFTDESGRNIVARLQVLFGSH